MISGLLFSVLMLMSASPAAQPPVCQVWGSSGITSSPENVSGASGYSRTTFSQNLNYGGTTIPNCPPVPGGNYVVTAKSWLDGAQLHLSCTVGTLNGDYVCENSWANNSQVDAGWNYSHPTNSTMSGEWCAHGGHTFYNATTGYAQGPDSYGCQTYPDPPSGGGGGEEGGGEGCSDPAECNYSPILIPVKKPKKHEEKYKLTSAESGVVFDINGDGRLDQTAWTKKGSGLAFLALDRNGNGIIDDGTELFGDSTLPGVSNGFAALRQIMPRDPNGRGWITDADPIYARLLLWEDKNHNGFSEPNELRPFSDLYTRIGLGYTAHNKLDEHGNLFRYQGFAEWRTEKGKNKPQRGREQLDRQVDIWDVFFKVVVQ